MNTTVGRLAGALLILLLAGPAWGQGVGIFSRPDCTTITDPVAGQTFCFDQTANTLKKWTGTAWLEMTGSSDASATVYVDQHGARPDGVARTDCSILSGSAVLTCTAGQFTTADVGKVIGVYGAKTANAGYPQVLYTTIASRQSSTQVTLSVSANVTVNPSTRVVYGTDNTAVLQNIIDTTVAAPSATGSNVGGEIVFGPGLYIVKSINLPCSTIKVFAYYTCTRAYNNIWFRGAGQQTTTLENIDPSTTTALFQFADGSCFVGCADGNNLIAGLQWTDMTMRQVLNALSTGAKTMCCYVLQHSLVQRVTLTGSSYECMHFSSWYGTIRDNYSSGCGAGGPGYGNPLSAYNLTCADCLFVNNRFDMALGGGGFATEASFNHGLVQGNHFICDPVNGGTGFQLNNEGAGIYDVTIQDNLIENCNEAIHVANGNAMANRVRIRHNTVINGKISVGSGVEALGDGQDLWPSIPDTAIHDVSTIEGNALIIDGQPPSDVGIFIGDYPPGTVSSHGQESWHVANNTFTIRKTTCSNTGAVCHQDSDCTPGVCQIPRGASFIDIWSATGGNEWRPSTACTQQGTTPQTQVSTTYVYPVVYNGYYYRCTTAGTTGTTEPTWPTTLGATVADGSAVWTNAGRKPTISLSNNSAMGPDNRGTNFRAGNLLIIREYADRNAIRISGLTANYPATVTEFIQPTGNTTVQEQIPPGAAYGDTQRFLAAVPTYGYFGINTQIANTAPSAGHRGWVATRAGHAGATWQTGHAYAFGDWVVPTVDNGHAFTQRTAAGCTSHATTEPTWNTADNALTADNTCSWKESGAAVRWLEF